MSNAAYAPARETAEWLASRQVGIGSSDAPAVCGVDPYKTALEVYVSKTDGHEPTGELPEDPAMRWGLLLEPAIARAYELETGATLHEPSPAKHRSIAWMGATADRMRDDGRIVELKTASSHSVGWGEAGDPDGIPERVAVQVAHQMAVYGATVADVAVLIDGRDFRIYPVERNDRLIESMIVIEADFWKLVERREPPEPDWTHYSTPELLSRIHKPFEGKEVSLPDDCLPLVNRYVDLADDIKTLELARTDCKARLIHAMQDAARGHVSGYTVTRKTVQRKAYEVKASEYVDFRIKAPKAILVS